MYKKCRSYADQSACVAALADTCVNLSQQLGYSNADARSIALSNVESIARSGQMTLNLLDSWRIGDHLIKSVIPQILGITNEKDEASIQSAGGMLNTSVKLALVVLAQFQVENIFRNIHREIIARSPSKSFYRCAEAVLIDLGLSPLSMNTLNTPARIRNSLHSNGIYHRQHVDEPVMVELDGVNYEFYDGKRVRCASWEHLAHALECSIKVIGEIFRHGRVSGIPDPMMDQFSWEHLTDPQASNS